MTIIRPFKAIRPNEDLVDKIASLPYDVYSSEEARKVVEKNPLSFLKIDRAETMFPEGIDMYVDEVYEKALSELQKMKRDGEYIQEEKSCFYIYALMVNGKTQRGLVCCTSIDDYLNNVIKKHENTRVDKELDRIRHVEACSAHTGPIFMVYRANDELRKLIDEVVAEKPIYDFISDDGIGHQVWRICEEDIIKKVIEIFSQINSIYVADGHHRAASAVRAGLHRRNQMETYDGTEEFNYFLSVLFDERELQILDYNRVVHGVSSEILDYLPENLKENFEVTVKEKELVKPQGKGEIGMYVKGCWYLLEVKEHVKSEDVVEGMDVSLLQNYVLDSILGIKDFKTDPRLQFVGGIRGLDELVKLVDYAGEAVAFAMHPTSMEELLRVADEGRLMPPKSTWFEPKLRSGIFIHEF